MNKNTFACIMAGGIGSRFWPASRTAKPKQFLDILGTGRTLIQATYDRFLKICPKENIFILTHIDYINLVKAQLPDITDDQILTEPARKNTAPCIAYSTFKINKLNPDANIIVAPSDHIILNEAEFVRISELAIDFVSKNNALATLGIRPTRPDTGYGYIQYFEEATSEGIHKVKTFTEKPDLELAKTFIASGDFLWNAGIFVWQVKNIVAAFEKLLPELNELFETEKASFNTASEQEAIDRIYPQCVNISIDYGIMEKADNVYIIPSSFGWSDLGTWGSAYENLQKDYLENAVAGDNVVVIDATKNMVHADNKKLVLLQGLDDFIVVDTKDVLMICKKDREQEIKQYVAEIKRSKGDKFL